MAVSSLLNLSLSALARNVSLLESELETLPVEVKSKCLKLLSRRGLVNDANIHKLLHKKTHVLDLSGCDGVSDVGLTAANACSNLVKLDLNALGATGRLSISSKCLASLAPFWPHLQVVFLRRCSLVTDHAIVTIAENCLQLRHLNVSGCRSVTDASLKAIAKCSLRLESIDMSRTRVSDSGVECLAVGCCGKSLREVHMGHCVELSDSSITVLLVHCRQITTLVFHGCPLITDESRVTLQSSIGPSRPMKQLTWTVY